MRTVEQAYLVFCSQTYLFFCMDTVRGVLSTYTGAVNSTALICIWIPVVFQIYAIAGEKSIGPA